MKYKLVSNSFTEIINILVKMALDINPMLENMRVVFTKSDDSIIYLFSSFDFIDLDPTESSVEKISLYQLID